MNPKIFTYWEGVKPPYISLCESIILTKTKDIFDYIQVNDSNLFDYLPKESFVENFFKLTPNHRSDYLRCALLLKHGGTWLDADQILVSDLSDIVILLNTFDYIAYEWEPLTPSGGFIASHKDCILLQKWKEKMDFLLESRFKFAWEELAYTTMHPILKEWVNAKVLRYYAFKPRSSFAPIYWSDWGQFFLTDRIVDDADLHSVMLYNSQFPDWFKMMPVEEILSKDYAISKLFRKHMSKS